MPMTNAPWRGVFTIPVTPFHEDGSIDWASLRSCVEFCIEAGAHGIVMPVNASEFFTLTDDERDEVVRVGVEVTDGAVPFVAGLPVCHRSTPLRAPSPRRRLAQTP